MSSQVVKQPEETRAFLYDFRPELGEATISLVVSATSVPRGSGANLASAGSSFGNGQVSIRWGGGVDGEDYLTTVIIRDSFGDTHKLDGEILVREQSFAVPASAGRYLTVAEYVTRFTREEVVRVTDETRTGSVDEGKVLAAINDAAEVVDGYLAGRYQLPLSPVPNSIKGLVADLARERLFKTRPLQAVSDAAGRARSMLLDLAAGRMRLLLPDAAQATPAAKESRARVGAAQGAAVFNSETLGRFGF